MENTDGGSSGEAVVRQIQLAIWREIATLMYSNRPDDNRGCGDPGCCKQGEPDWEGAYRDLEEVVGMRIDDLKGEEG